MDTATRRVVSIDKENSVRHYGTLTPSKINIFTDINNVLFCFVFLINDISMLTDILGQYVKMTVSQYVVIAAVS